LLARSVGGGDRRSGLICRYLAQELGLHEGVSDAAARDLDCHDLRCFPVNAEMKLAPDPPLGSL
jgi:hypothetical protein